MPAISQPALDEASTAATAATAANVAAALPRLRRIVLTGFMGAGKSTIGKLLATHLNWSFLDLDAHLEARTGSTVPQLFELHGEAHFRRLESTALASALARSASVLALGGGTPESLTNRLLLEQTPGTLTVFLDAPFSTLYDRCMLQALNSGSGSGSVVRPLLSDPATAQLRFTERQPLYRRMARITLDTAAQSPIDTAAALLSTLIASPQPFLSR